ncbi:MAG: DNA-directed DNA polymerase II small subunit [Candidatus Methanomethylophilaceae archaeon]
MFLSPDALEYILSNSDPIDFTQTVLSSLSKNAVFVTKEDVIGCLNGESKIFESPKPITPRNKRQYDISIIPGTDVTGNSTCEGNIENFARYFQNRYAILKKIIEHRMDFGSAMSIDRAMTMDRDVKIIGIINDVKKTPNNHIILALEDDQGGTCKVLILNSSPYVKNIFVDDQVIGVIGRSGSKKNLLVADKIVYPDVPLTNEWIPSDSTSSVAFLSDVHVGSYTFLEKNWKKMIDWLKINAEKMEINYLILPGDVVDGIGIFPGQEEELSILDIYEQYETLGEYLKEIPDNIKMVIHPGNHDACRPAEPQPALNSVFTKTFDSNVMSVSNPVYINIEGRKILTYHGKSIDDWIANVQKLTYDNPIEVMKEMVTCRHLAPIYGQKTALAPEKKDYLAMETIPDIFVSGHIHGAGCTEYRGIKLINASTWQDQTEYQKMHNFNPNPGIMPIVQLGNGKITMKSFM